MLDPADGGPGASGVPADHDQVRPAAVAGQHPGGVVVDNVRPDGHGGVLVPPGLEGVGQVPVRLRRELRRIGWLPGCGE